MPYFKWVGIDYVGTRKRGKHAAHSEKDLAEQLLKRNIALLHCKKAYVSMQFRLISDKFKADLFQQKAKLLRAGLLLPHVLDIVIQQSYNNPLVYDVLFNLNRDIRQGVSFADAIERYRTFCNSIIMVMLIAGHESGNLVNAVENVSLYFYKQHVFKKSLGSVLAMPLLTLLFFIGISVFIFAYIVPRFTDIFASLQQELPPLTQRMIYVSEFVRSFSIIYALGFLALAFFVLRYYFTAAGKKIWDRLLIKAPFTGAIVWQHQMSQVSQALSLLIGSGVTLVVGLKIIGESIDNFYIKSCIVQLYNDVSAGQLLSSSMASLSVFSPEIVAFIHVGEETATLAQSLENVALVYNNKVEESLRRFVFFLQPAVIIILGFLVTLLIFAVYLPIMQLSHVL